jgi:hypothetical protein
MNINKDSSSNRGWGKVDKNTEIFVRAGSLQKKGGEKLGENLQYDGENTELSHDELFGWGKPGVIPKSIHISQQVHFQKSTHYPQLIHIPAREGSRI